VGEVLLTPLSFKFMFIKLGLVCTTEEGDYWLGALPGTKATFFSWIRYIVPPPEAAAFRTVIPPELIPALKLAI